jgi:pilus assembly protein CpaB
MGRRTILLITSILVAALGTALVAIYVRGAEARASSGVETVQVIVAGKTIPEGSSVANAAQASSFVKGPALRKQVTSDTVKLLSDLDDMQGYVAAGPILQGQIIQKGMFRSGAAPADTGLPDDRMAVSVQMADPNRVAALIQSNSQVAVFVTRGQAGSQSTQLLLPKVRVLGVGSATTAQVDTPSSRTNRSGGTQESVPTTIVTLDVDQREAQRLILATKAGELYFTLLGKNAVGSPNVGAINEKNLVP